eukprot:14806809-Alexandrium_andersonii.AAC.1
MCAAPRPRLLLAGRPRVALERPCFVKDVPSFPPNGPFLAPKGERPRTSGNTRTKCVQAG